MLPPLLPQLLLHMYVSQHTPGTGAAGAQVPSAGSAAFRTGARPCARPGDIPVLESCLVVSQDHSRDVPGPKEALEGGWGKRLRISSLLQSQICSHAAAAQNTEQAPNLKKKRKRHRPTILLDL